MAGKVNSSKLIDELQRSVAPKASGEKRSYDSGKRHAGCDGHGCSAACGYHGYCDYEATRYYSSRKGKAESESNKECGHTYYRRKMRLGYDSETD